MIDRYSKIVDMCDKLIQKSGTEERIVKFAKWIKNIMKYGTDDVNEIKKLKVNRPGFEERQNILKDKLNINIDKFKKPEDYNPINPAIKPKGEKI